MTAKFLNNYPARNALRVISQNRKFAIILSILSILGIPLIFSTGLMDVYLNELRKGQESYQDYFNSEPYIMIGCFCAAIAVMLGIVCGIRAFEEEWSKSRVDMLYSLPLNGTQRFFSDYIGGFLMYIVPYIVSIILGWIILFIAVPMINSVSADPMLTEDVNRAYLYYFLGSIGLGVLMWMYYTIAAICASCCGTMFENIYTNLLLNLLIPGTFAAVLAVVTNHVDGLEFEYSWEFIGYMSPIGGLIYLFYMFAEYDFQLDYRYNGTYNAYGGVPEDGSLIPVYIRWIIVVIILTAGLTFLAWKLYQHRKAEYVGKPFIYIWIYYVIITAITVCLMCISGAEDDTLGAVIFFGAIVYFIMEVIRKRGFRKFWLSVITYIATVVVSIGVYAVIITTDCFGRTKYIPAVATVSSVEISFENSESGRTSRYHLTYRDRDTISKIENFHQEYFSNHENIGDELNNLCEKYHYHLNYSYNSLNDGYEYEDFSDNYYGYWDYRNRYTTEFNITYNTIAGTKIHRTYDIFPDEYLNLMEICIGTEAYAQARGGQMKARLLNSAEKYNERTYTSYIPKNTEIYVEYFWDGDESGQKISVLDAEANLNLLAETYQQDMQNLSFESYRLDDIIGYIEDMPIYISNTGTVNLLKQWGFKEMDFLSMITNTTKDANSYSDNYSQNVLNMKIYSPEGYQTGSLKYPSYLSNRYETINFKLTADYSDTIMLLNDSDMKQYYSELTELLSHIRQNYISAEPCYLMIINGNYYMIPEAYSDLAENIIALGDYHYNAMFWGKPVSDINF